MSDGRGGTDVGHVTVDISCVARSRDRRATTPRPSSRTPRATAVAVLANDTDADGGPMTIAAVTQPTHGTVAITGGGTGLTYQPSANYCNNPPAAPGHLHLHARRRLDARRWR